MIVGLEPNLTQPQNEAGTSVPRRPNLAPVPTLKETFHAMANTDRNRLPFWF